jgi:cytochrome b561
MSSTPDQSSRYPRSVVLLHWLIAVLIAFMIGLGYYMLTIPKGTPARGIALNLHKSLGLLTLALIVIRLARRATIKAPPLPGTVPRWQRLAATASHHLLYLCMLVQPVTGYLASSFGKYGVKFFGLPLPNWGWDDPGLRQLFVTAHETVVILFIALIVVHGLAAMKHLLVERNGVFQRMLP